MRKTMYLIILLCLFIPIKVNAQISGYGSMNCALNANNTKVVCTLYATVVSGNLNEIKGYYSLSDGLSFDSITVFDNWSVTSKTNTMFDISNTSNVTGTNNMVASIVFNITNSSYNSYAVGFLNMVYTDSDSTTSAANIATSIINVPTTTTTTTTTATTEKVTIGVTIKAESTSSPYTTTTYPIAKDNTLSNMSIEGHDINFLRELYTYSIVIPKEETSITVNYELTNPSYKAVVFGTDNLALGKNVATITVTDNDGDSKVYTINVYRGNYLLNSDASLKSLSICNYTLDFQSDVYQYNLNIRNDSELNLTIVPTEATTVYQIDGNENLKDGSVITITAIAQDNTVLEYRLIIHFEVQTINPYLVYVPLTMIWCYLIYLGIMKYKSIKVNKIIENIKNKIRAREEMKLDFIQNKTK